MMLRIIILILDFTVDLGKTSSNFEVKLKGGVGGLRSTSAY